MALDIGFLGQTAWARQAVWLAQLALPGQRVRLVRQGATVQSERLDPLGRPDHPVPLVQAEPPARAAAAGAEAAFRANAFSRPAAEPAW